LVSQRRCCGRRSCSSSTSRRARSTLAAHNAAYWDGVTAGFDFSRADQVPPAQFNRVLWAGLMENRPYPGFRQPFFVR